jgi:uncharacterized glyoxalase superfamily protein PhnB
MEAIFNTYRPEGFHTLNPYLFTKDPEGFINFLKRTFYARELSRTINDKNGEVANCILKIGDSCFMVSQARGEFENMRTSFYLYADDVDLLYKNALEQGAASVLAPADMDYNDRQAGVKDTEGNYWWISKRLVQSAYQD